MNNVVGFAMCGSFCTFDKAIKQMKKLKELGYDIIPIMSETAYNTDTRFGTAEEFRGKIKEITDNDIIHSIISAEPVGPKKLLDILVVAPCTGNTLAKLANGITDTAVTMAVKAHLRNERPVVLNVSTNDGLSGTAKNIGKLLNYKNIFFVPMLQDDCGKKPKSIVADFDMIPKTVELALKNQQIQPIIK